ncbi:MAG TPA: hypothetical protein VHM64_02880 [Candidatus Binatia bacterium]|nr:hypothetical protein [Candidatus Binatia bacterium]
MSTPADRSVSVGRTKIDRSATSNERKDRTYDAVGFTGGGLPCEWCDAGKSFPHTHL